MIQLGD